MKASLMIVSGDSMNGVLTNGDMVLLKQERKIRSGDIFIYNSNGSYIIHRALFVGISYIWEIGDNNYHIKRVKKNEIIAKVVTNVTKKINLEYPKLNRKISRLNIIRYLFRNSFDSPKSLIRNKTMRKLFLIITRCRNKLQKQYGDLKE